MLLIDKPIGTSSFQVVATVRRLCGERTVGHAGTLDPLASGLLIVLVGRAETKQQDRFMKLNKEYVVTIELGKLSTTDDAEGRIAKNAETASSSYEEIAAGVKKFIGTIQQKPPVYSAVHVNGERAYRLARQGKIVDLPVRQVKIFSIKILEYNNPFITLKVNCSHGTYIRSLARDLGGYVTALRRTKIGEYDVSSAISLAQIETTQNQSLIPE